DLAVSFRIDFFGLVGAGFTPSRGGASLFWNQGGGTFTDESRVPLSSGIAEDLLAVKLNPDATDDLVTVNGLLLGRANRTFEERAAPALSGANSLRAADFDGDGDLDLLGLSATGAGNDRLL